MRAFVQVLRPADISRALARLRLSAFYPHRGRTDEVGCLVSFGTDVLTVAPKLHAYRSRHPLVPDNLPPSGAALPCGM